MFQCDYLYEDNYINKKNRMLVKLQKQGKVIIKLKDGALDGLAIADLACKLAYVLKTYKRGCRKIVLLCPELNPKDKLSYILFEAILFDLVVNKKYDVEVGVDNCVPSIVAEGIFDSTINNFQEYKRDLGKYIRKFSFEQNRNHFRRLISKEQSDGSALSALLGELKTFFYTSEIDKTETDQLANVITELADNVGEHTKSDCLIDVDISINPYKKEGDSGATYIAVNTVVVNFDEKCLSNDVEEKIKNHYFGHSSRYEMIEEAYNNHKKIFGRDYNEQDFFNVVSFQDAISGRKNETTTGGTGLTELIKSLETNAYEHGCYVLSGKQGLFFRPEFLEYNKENWLGFNISKDFIHQCPDHEIILRSSTFLRGTAYNFTLIYRRKE